MKQIRTQTHALNISTTLLTVIIFIEGICVMTVELGTAQILTPFYGNNLIVWTTVLGMTLLFLSIGYYLGGIITKINRHYFLMSWILISVAASLSMMPLIGSQLMEISEMFSWETGWVFTAFLLLAIPLILLGTLPPIIIQFFSEKTDGSGNSAGKVFGISTMGNIAAAFLIGFLFIPGIGVTNSIIIISFLLLILSVMVLPKQHKKIALIIIFAIAILNINKMKKKTFISSSFRIQDFHEGLMGQLMVVDLPSNNKNSPKGWNRMLLVNKMGQTYINLENQTTLGSYYTYASSISSIFPPRSKTLLVGLGGGTIAKSLYELGMDVTAVDLDSRMKDIAKKRFGLPSAVRVVINDGRYFIKTSKEKYSVIIFDTFRGESVPAHLLTVEFFQEVKKLLTPDGIVIFNFYGFLSGHDGKLAKSVYKTLLEASYPQVYIIPTYEKEETYRNILFVASGEPVIFENASSKLTINGVVADWNKIPIKLSSEEIKDAKTLRDNFPIQELWVLNSINTWRKNSYKNLTKELIENGVPLFN